MTNEKRYGRYNLTTTELVKEIQKTDKVIQNFKDAVLNLRSHEDKSNSSELEWFRYITKDIDIEVDI
jgi:hypothetical protein